MTEAQAWRKAAEYVSDEDVGLCTAVANVTRDPLQRQMEERIDDFAHDRFRPMGSLGCCSEDRGMLVLAALWLALEAENDTPAPLAPLS